MLVAMLSSLVGNDAATQCYTGCGKVVQPLSLEHLGVVAS
jgi:hypothetical protein